ncbi:hypothetical protein C8R47DRAFT_1209364 [Mycena vitilis]|nr:hypothetical protein C8R47DRAFT_1209364 [Mycena vitilis]
MARAAVRLEGASEVDVPLVLAEKGRESGGCQRAPLPGARDAESGRPVEGEADVLRAPVCLCFVASAFPCARADESGGGDTDTDALSSSSGSEEEEEEEDGDVAGDSDALLHPPPPLFPIVTPTHTPTYTHSRAHRGRPAAAFRGVVFRQSRRWALALSAPRAALDLPRAGSTFKLDPRRIDIQADNGAELDAGGARAACRFPSSFSSLPALAPSPSSTPRPAAPAPAPRRRRPHLERRWTRVDSGVFIGRMGAAYDS